jgi:sugar transferase EpsL
LLKRVLDLVVAIPLVVLLLPLFLFVGIVIRLESSGPMFFRQDRLGFRGRVFSIFKFRTMVHRRQKKGPDLFLSEDDPRITRFGGILRKYRLDELPQLLNVLKGEMSLVGPRPLLPEFLDSYTVEERRRMDVFPGMTGWQQVHGASTNSWEERISLDLWYVDNWSMAVDLSVLVLTIKVVLKADTVYDKAGTLRNGVPTRFSTGIGATELPRNIKED